MCVQDAEQEMENLDASNSQSWPSHCEMLPTQMDNFNEQPPVMCPPDRPSLRSSFPLESICEENVPLERRLNMVGNFIPKLRSGEWSDIGGRTQMEDTHICIGNLAETFGYDKLNEEVVSLYGVFDGHLGKAAAKYVCDHLPRVIVEDSDFPLELEKVVVRSFKDVDAAFAESCTLDTSLSSGTTALTAMIFGR